jgi:CheY-like chemotaxis protein
MINVGAYRVLVVDDEPKMCEVAQKQISEIAGPTAIYVDKAYTARVAIDKIRESFYDLIVLDLYRDSFLDGYEVYRKLNELGCSAEVIFMTRFDLDPSFNIPLKAISSQGSSRLVGFLDKADTKFGTVRNEVERRYRKFTRADLTIENIELASKLISRRRKRYARLRLFPLRENPSEIEAEIERLLRELYVEVPSGSDRSADISVTLEPIERRGLSAAVVVNCVVKIGLHGASEVREGHKTVLKIGPKPDIREEASRFREFVRYGVELDQRVELLGVAERDTLGGLVYSLAGGLHHKGLMALDDVLIMDMMNQNESLSRRVFQELFESRHWYSVTTDDIDVSGYFQVAYKNSLMMSFASIEEALLRLPNELGDHASVEKMAAKAGKESYFSVGIGNAEPLPVPNSSVLGLGAMNGLVRGCLVHGDMHAGNVMLEVSEDSDAPADKRVRLDRVFLIDFGNAGPGPRTIDAVALESSVRFADSEVACRRLSPNGEIGLSTSDRLIVTEELAARLPEEVELYRAVFYGDGEVPAHGWQAEAAEILFGLKNCFKDLTLAEYFSTSIRYTLRQLGMEILPVARVRMLVWLAGQYSLLQAIWNLPC